jgi:hypothetical protein
MAAPQARRPGIRLPTLVTSPRRRNRRLDWLLLRWQARLDARWADRAVPWLLAFGLFVIYAAVALARVDRLDAGPTLARHVQAAWQLAAGNPPEVTVGPDGNLFADRLPLLFVPLAALTRVLPGASTLLVAQAAALAVGVVPLWLLARHVVRLRVGAAAALAVVYAAHPALADLDLGDFHPQAMALAPLLFAAYFAEQRRLGLFGIAATISVLWSSELGLVVATIGFVLVAEGERKVGLRAIVLGLAWTCVALLFVQAPLGTTGLVAPGAYDAYGDSAFEVLIEMLRNPFRPIGDTLQRDDVQVVAWVLAPLAFLPLLSPRKLLPALPITALVLIADVPARGADGGARMVPLAAFSFVAATFALARLGRPSVERVIVDRRFLAVVLAAALAATALDSPLSPYDRPWDLGRSDEEARRRALDALPPVLAVRVPADLVTEVAERTKVEVIDGDEVNPAAIVQGVDAVILDEDLYVDLDASARLGLRRAIAAQGLLQVFREEGLVVFVLPEWER